MVWYELELFYKPGNRKSYNVYLQIQEVRHHISYCSFSLQWFIGLRPAREQVQVTNHFVQPFHSFYLGKGRM